MASSANWGSRKISYPVTQKVKDSENKVNMHSIAYMQIRNCVHVTQHDASLDPNNVSMRVNARYRDCAKSGSQSALKTIFRRVID